MTDQFRVEFTLMRKRAGEDDYTEIGFGSSGGSGTVDHAMHLAQSAVQNREWETTDGQPDPRSVDDAA